MTQDLSTAAAERHPHTEFAAPGSVPRDEKHRNVPASDHQDQRYHAHQHIKRLLVFAVKAFDASRGSEVKVDLVLRLRLLTDCLLDDVAILTIDLRECLLRGNSRIEPSNHHQEEPIGAAIHRHFFLRRSSPGLEVRTVLKWDPDVDGGFALQAGKSWSSDADDGEGNCLYI